MGVGELHVIGDSGPDRRLIINVNVLYLACNHHHSLATVRRSYIKSVLIVVFLSVFTHCMFKRLFSFGQNVSRAYSFRPIRPLPIVSATILPTQVNNIASMSTNPPAPVTKTEDEWRAQLSPEQVG